MDSHIGTLRSDLSLLRRLATARLRGRPPILSHLITARCNARCETCLWREGTGGATSPPEVAELTTEEISWLYREAGAAGMAALVLWGGEPLLRPDLPGLLEAATRAGLSVALITNGRLLPERWPELRDRVHTLILSLDDVGEAQDRMRGIPGLFALLDTFIMGGAAGDVGTDRRMGLARHPERPRFVLNTVLSRLNVGALRRVAPVAKHWGAGLYFCPMETGEMLSAGFDPRKNDLALPPDELRRAAALAAVLLDAGYPLLSSRHYLELLTRDPGLRAYRCRAPHAVFTVCPDGSIRDCLRRDIPLGHVRELRERGDRLGDFFVRAEYRRVLRDADHCTVCNNPDVIETSWAWQLRPFMLAQAFRLYGP